VCVCVCVCSGGKFAAPVRNHVGDFNRPVSAASGSRARGHRASVDAPLTGRAVSVHRHVHSGFTRAAVDITDDSGGCNVDDIYW